MEYSKRFTMSTAAFLLLLLLINERAAADDGFKEVQKKVCEYKSEKFWGICLNDIKCADVCKKEGFEGGDCQGLRRRCYCYTHCKQLDPSSPPLQN